MSADHNVPSEFAGAAGPTSELPCSEVPNRGQFRKGESGNPGGRPKHLLPDGRGLREVARAHTEEAVIVLAQIMRDGTAPKAARVAAANAILDRGWGKPTQEFAVESATLSASNRGVSPEEAQRRIDSLIQLAMDRAKLRFEASKTS